MEKPRATIYDMDFIKGIPLGMVLTDCGIDIRRGTFKIRNERTASCKLYYETNTWADFGGGSHLGGGPVEAVMAREGLSWAEAVQVLGARYNAPVVLNGRENTVDSKTVSPAQYSRIGLVASPAYANILRPEDADSFTGQQVQDIRQRYDMSMNQLYRDDKGTYEAILSSVSVPYLKECQNAYRRSLYLYDVERNVPSSSTVTVALYKQIAQDQHQEYTEMHKAMAVAAVGTEIDVSRMASDFEKDLARIQTISIEIGDFSYASLKALPGGNRHQEIPENLYRSFTRELERGGVVLDAPFSAHQKGDTVTISYKEGDEPTFGCIFASLNAMAKYGAVENHTPGHAYVLGEHEY